MLPYVGKYSDQAIDTAKNVDNAVHPALNYTKHITGQLSDWEEKRNEQHAKDSVYEAAQDHAGPLVPYLQHRPHG